MAQFFRIKLLLVFLFLTKEGVSTYYGDDTSMITLEVVKPISLTFVDSDTLDFGTHIKRTNSNIIYSTDVTLNIEASYNNANGIGNTISYSLDSEIDGVTEKTIELLNVNDGLSSINTTIRIIDKMELDENNEGTVTLRGEIGENGIDESRGVGEYNGTVTLYAKYN